MTDELLLILANMADVSPEQVRMIVDAYEKATTGVKPVPEGYTIFKYEGKRYAYKSLGVGSWTPQCASLKLMKVLRNYFISSGKMEEGGCWPDSGCHWAWTGDVVELYSNGGTGSCDDFFPHSRFAVIPL